MNQAEVQELIDSSVRQHQWRFRGTLALGVLVIAIVTALCWTTISSYAPVPQPKTVASIEGVLSNTDLALRRLVQLIATDQTGVTPSKKIELDATLSQFSRSFESQATASKAALEELKKQSSSNGDSLIPYANLITGGLFLGLLGFLGLTRLGQIDQELKGLRENLLKEVSDRVRLSEEASTAKLSTSIQEKVEGVQKSVEEAARVALEKVSTIESQSSMFLLETRETQDRIREQYNQLSQELKKIATRYPFLMSAEKRDLVSKIEHVQSVEQVESLATDLHRKGEHDTAAKALEQIVERRLPGSPDSLHNAHSEAMRMNSTSIALAIAQYGLELFPGNCDLAADAVLASTNGGFPAQAIELGEKWLKANEKSQRTWRFAVFLAKSYRAQGMSPEIRTIVTDLLEREVLVLPREPKVWSELVQVYREFDSEKAYETIERALLECPTSQELKFLKAQYLLEDGDSAGAKPVLENAIASDFQDQFQSNVNGAAVLCYYGQCLEALGERNEARRVFGLVKSQPGCHPVMAKFIDERTLMLDVLDGKEPDESASPGIPMQLLELLRARSSQGSEGGMPEDSPET